MATSMSSVSLTARPRMAAGKTRAPLRVVAQQAREGVSAKVAKVAKAASVAGAVLASTPAAHAAVQEVAQIAEVNTVAVAAVGTGAIVGLAAVLAADPEKRRKEMASEAGGDEMASVKKYFETEGFKRWDKIYGETDEVNKVQLDIRKGHAVTVEKVLKWVDEEGGVEGLTIADCGCGTGSLAVPLATRGAVLSASDISSAMVGEAESRYQEAVKNGAKAPSVAPKWESSDLESVSGKYNTVTCLDVMIHYPQEKADAMVQHLASLAEDRLIISFAPYTFALGLLKKVGELFPGPSKATRAYLHAEADVEKALEAAGFKVVKREMTSTQFYFSRLLEAKRV